jgi:cytochrome bd ubiquinol oxidase subunit I
VLGSIVTGDSSARGVAHNQPPKLAAMEGVFTPNAPAGLHLFGWVNEKDGTVVGPEIPGLLSWLVSGDADAPITGLHAVPETDWPPVNRVFQAFHAMVAIGFAMLALVLAALVQLWRGKLFETRWLLWLFVFAVLGPQLANQLGWMTAELGRQPWIVYGIMRTSDAVSPVVAAGDVWLSIGLFTFVYLLLFAMFVFLLDQKIKHGPLEEDLDVTVTGLARA